MTDLLDDVIDRDEPVGRNVFYAGTRIPDRSGDDSLRPKDRAQHPVPPNSLLWKYMGDLFVLAANGQRAAIIENMWPQLGQGVSDHSVVVSSHDLKILTQRAKNSSKSIGGILFAAPEDARKYGIQVRNFHKSVKGDMPNGRTYHAINAETFYWAHVTFFEQIYRASDMGLFPKPLTRAEKEQIFEESKEWFSMMGVDDRAQPGTYAEFEVYYANVLGRELVNSKLSQYTVALARPGAWKSKFFPERIRPALRLVDPLLTVALRMFTVGSLEPRLREELRLSWSAGEQLRFDSYIALLRVTRMAAARLRLPLRYRYLPAAAAAFDREGIDPERITLESARAALQAARANRTAPAQTIESVPAAPAPAAATCAKCARALQDCQECDGTGSTGDEPCDVCHGARRGCPVHHADWAQPCENAS
ncbi:DUF2236 domain-containing protein [Nocardia huaxiensis]|uniref:DUF2236 domain-containing protein n=1 Tax=Nocardia huaxiensis TaxID=2755382 RepID=A0A7D6V6E1_9NOCA|nr:oxygenase MpaB family protein [Nocardia huaxiensis]QLY28672.1 DUF2236 domain-containing protein [Nocardia huaxiensis]